MFTVKIEPRQIEQDDYTGAYTSRTVYDLHVYDGYGEGQEELLVFSNQGYENRADAVNLAYRLFGSALVEAGHLGLDVSGYTGEMAVLTVLDADGNLHSTVPLR